MPSHATQTVPYLRAFAAHPVVIAVGLDPIGFSRLRLALLHGAPTLGPVALTSAPTWTEALVMSPPASPAAVVFDPFAQRLTPTFSERYPQARLVAYGELDHTSPSRLVEVLRGGAHEFVTRDVDDTPTGFLYRLSRAGLRGRR
jgi:hypothetical protein